MFTIHKYEIPPHGKFDLKMPKEAEVLSFKVQNEKPVMWVILDTESELIDRHFVTYATGEKIDEKDAYDLDYIGTVLFAGGAIVTHLFEVADFMESVPK